MSRGTGEVLEELHALLAVKFRALHEARQQLTPAAPVFALEHGLSGQDLELLKEKVRAAVQQGFGPRLRQWWLPFVVYAAESGYEYSGGEYWHTFEDRTPYWGANGDRDRIRMFFEGFARDFGGARPQGAFAEAFTIIAWPITHAVLPTDLQRHLARLLFEFRTGLTAQLLQDPSALGARLAGRTGPYTERFRLFCQNTALLGQVSVALLSGVDGESPYLQKATLQRIAEGLSKERETRQWLRAAQLSARELRSRAIGFVPEPRPAPVPPQHSGLAWLPSQGAAHAGRQAARPQRLPAPTDPRLLLRRAGKRWRAYAELPDFSSLTARLPHLSGEFRTQRPRVAGADRAFLARGQLLFPGHEVRLANWPEPDEPFISLERGTATVNALLADQCVVSPGPAWLFRCRASGLAAEVKGKVLRPGASYVLVTSGGVPVPGFPWVSETVIEVQGVRAFFIDVPETLRESDMAALRRSGVSVASDVRIRPAGVVASNWDGEGSVEWLAGEPGILAISAEKVPQACAVTIGGERSTIEWPGQDRELLLRLDDLPAGVHEASVALLGENGKAIAEGSLIVTIRDPHARVDGATEGEGIRLLADPAQPSFSDLWDGRAAISIDGPSAAAATLTVTLLSDEGEQLAEIARPLPLPVTPGDWSRVSAAIREEHRFRDAYDDAQAARITVGKAGIGFASLTSDRGFHPLRWRVTRRHDLSHAARLIDRTDGTRTKAELFRVDAPLTAVPCALDGDIPVPPQGGLLRASAGKAVSTVLLPTQPNELLRTGPAAPKIRTAMRSADEVMRLAAAHQMWHAAERPGDPFAAQQQASVLEAITRATASLVAGDRWGALETRMGNGDDLMNYLGAMQRHVGDSPSERAIADAIARRLWAWSDLGTLRVEFGKIIEAATTRDIPVNMTKFVVTLASRPGRIITQWNPEARAELLNEVLRASVLMRAARFAVLGARATHRLDTTSGGDR